MRTRSKGKECVLETDFQRSGEYARRKHFEPGRLNEGEILKLFENQIDKLRLVTVRELAVILQVSEKTIRDWVLKEKVPVERINGSVRFNPLKIARWIAEGRNTYER